MDRRLSPREKKQFEYERDTRVVAEHPKAYRRGHPKKKQAINQRERRRLDRMMAAAIAVGGEGEVTPASCKPRSRSDVQNLTMVLGRFIDRQREYRVGRTGKKAAKHRVAEQMKELCDAIRASGERLAHVVINGQSWCGEHATVRLEGWVESPAALRELQEIVARYVGPNLVCEVGDVQVVRKEEWWRHGRCERRRSGGS
jgi:hypothetical protein